MSVWVDVLLLLLNIPAQTDPSGTAGVLKYHTYPVRSPVLLCTLYFSFIICIFLFLSFFLYLNKLSFSLSITSFYISSYVAGLLNA